MKQAYEAPRLDLVALPAGDVVVASDPGDNSTDWNTGGLTALAGNEDE